MHDWIIYDTLIYASFLRMVSLCVVMCHDSASGGYPMHSCTFIFVSSIIYIHVIQSCFAPHDHFVEYMQ